MVHELTTETFKEKVFDYTKNEDWSFEGKKPAVVDYFAEWCGPCKTIAPILEELSEEYENVDFYKINTEEQNELAANFGIQSIPALLFVPLKGEPKMVLGTIPKATLEQAINEVLGLDAPEEKTEETNGEESK